MIGKLINSETGEVEDQFHFKEQEEFPILKYLLIGGAIFVAIVLGFIVYIGIRYFMSKNNSAGGKTKREVVPETDYEGVRFINELTFQNISYAQETFNEVA